MKAAFSHFLAASFCVFASPSFGQPLPEVHNKDSSGLTEICGIHGATVNDIRNQVLKLNGIQKLETLTANYESYADSKTYHIWTFAMNSNPIRPAVVCRAITSRGAGSNIEMRVFCLDTKAKCDKLVRDFRQLDHKNFGTGAQ